MDLDLEYQPPSHTQIPLLSLSPQNSTVQDQGSDSVSESVHGWIIVKWATGRHGNSVRWGLREGTPSMAAPCFSRVHVAKLYLSASAF